MELSHTDRERYSRSLLSNVKNTGNRDRSTIIKKTNAQRRFAFIKQRKMECHSWAFIAVGHSFGFVFLKRTIIIMTIRYL